MRELSIKERVSVAGGETSCCHADHETAPTYNFPYEYFGCVTALVPHVGYATGISLYACGAALSIVNFVENCCYHAASGIADGIGTLATMTNQYLYET